MKQMNENKKHNESVGERERTFGIRNDLVSIDELNCMNECRQGEKNI